MDDIVNDKSNGTGAEKEFSDIEKLQDRFKNLKNENEKLMQRKLKINQDMEDARRKEAERLATL